MSLLDGLIGYSSDCLKCGTVGSLDMSKLREGVTICQQCSNLLQRAKDFVDNDSCWTDQDYTIDE
jgi:hypothetical protein